MRDASALANCVYLLVGQQGAGKSEYARRLIKQHPELFFVSRDEILMKEFGTVFLDSYSGGHVYAYELMYRLLQDTLSAQRGITMILDTWTGDRNDREHLIARLREYGADRVAALYFVTPLPLVELWFWQKPGVAKISEMRAHQGEGFTFFCEDAPKRDYQMFHKLAKDIDLEGFDEVIRIDPSQELITIN
jgi:hypothetical protein